MITMNKGWWFAGFFLLVTIICIGTVQAGPVTVFSDDFNDNSLDTGKWTADVVGTNNLFQEQNQRAEFTTYGPAAPGYHSLLRSQPVLIEGWETIEITGAWTSDSTTSRTYIARITDIDSSNFISIEYDSYLSNMDYFWKEGSSIVHVSRPPTSLVPFRLIITKTGFEYYENNVLLKSAPTSSMADATQFQILIGGWDYSAFIRHSYIDDIVVKASFPLTQFPVSAPEFPSAFLPAMFVIGILGTVFYIRSTRES